MPDADRGAIRIRGARQNNLKNLDLDLPIGELTVVTGVSGSGKSSLVFDTVYAEGQRRYVETFSPYARQFLDRMDRPQVGRIDGVPPAIAIDQTNPVRTSRSTVGTMTELNDHLKLLFARAATLHCERCDRPVQRDDPQTILRQIGRISETHGDPRLLITFPVAIPHNFTEAEVRASLERQGYTRIHERGDRRLQVVQDRLRWSAADGARRSEAIEGALRYGDGRVDIYPLAADDGALAPWRFSTGLHCAHCDIAYPDPTPSTFSFNSPLGACGTCRGFGRTIGVDYGLVIPDDRLSLQDGAIKPWQTPAYAECQTDLLRFARRRGIPVDVAWRELDEAHRRWVIDGEGDWNRKVWYGVARFFAWLETKAYKMHIRVLLSRYRSYAECPECGGARLKRDALRWRIGTPGRNVRELTLLPLDRCREFFEALELPAAHAEATKLLLGEIRSRLRYLCEVGLGYLNLDRQSRTLSGGEVQRINLTTALGTSLVNTLFVLDEPSIGLHARDAGRITGVMRRLRDAGNTLLVVEHDPEIMRAADRILDIGPGPGERGGEIVFFGPLGDFATARGSLTADYLFGRVHGAVASAAAEAPQPGAASIRVEGATMHNLRDVTVEFPLRRLVCVTGVSGSGKSTLVHEVLYRALLRAKGRPTDPAGAHRRLVGADSIADVVMIDQSPIGRTARSNPASFVGAFDAIRAIFAASPESRRRKYTAGTFSFNSGTGRCPSCGGNGFEHVEMQFLSDVYLRCPDCDGRRYRAEVLEVRIAGAGRPPAGIADVLDMTVREAIAFFAADATVQRALQPLVDVGLDYLRLGQPVPTLSGGEAQRLKLAAHLVPRAAPDARDGKGTLFICDEPTTGLHFDDVAKLLRAFRRLIDAGHSLLVIEHHLDVIRAADWIVDLGPEGGDGGGTVVCVGTPAMVAATPDSHTGAALARVTAPVMIAPPPGRATPATAPSVRSIEIRGAREHNLKNIDLAIERDRFTVITGVSGSGKSTLAFDIVFAEGQRRYLESLNAYARQFVQPATRADVDAIHGIPPTVAIEQRTSRGGRKSTVATLTEIYHFLRLLYVKLGVAHCPTCRVPIEPQSEAAIAAGILRTRRGRTVTLLAPLVKARKGLYTDLAKWARSRGYATLRVDGKPLPTARWPRLDRYVEHDIDLAVATLEVSAANEGELRTTLARALELGRGVVLVEDAASGRRRDPATYSTERTCPSCGTGFPELDPRLFSFNSRHGWCTRCFGTGAELAGFDAAQSGEESVWTDGGTEPAEPCGACGGQRLNPTALAVTFRGRTIAESTRLSVEDFAGLWDDLELSGREHEIARDAIAEIVARTRFLSAVGLGYLPLDRGAPTLSGGEAQRIRLAAQLGSNLQGVCYVLDEPTIGLHPRDNHALLDTLEALRAKGNTLIVVEHDEDTIRRADRVIDLGPAAGELGGRVVATGTAAQLMRHPESLTGRCLSRPILHPRAPRRPVARQGAAIRIEGANLHNLRAVDARFPIGRFTVVTGVSGSGKSTLARDVLLQNVKRRLASRDARAAPIGCRRIDGIEPITRVLEVDQTPIGRTPRSCPATYVGFWDGIRRLFAESGEARVRGYDASRFSFNTAGGRCASCEGQGLRRIEMSFLPDVQVVCEACGGLRFNPETLHVRFKDRTIGDVLAMSVDEAVEFFAAHGAIRHALELLADVGLGYLRLGQPSPTLSGGESQRIKLVTELAKARPRPAVPAGRRQPPHTLYVLDEPTVGLHMADVERLMRVVHRLIDSGNTVVAIEHNLDVMAEADWIIDLGPEGGARGGRRVAAGPPETLIRAAARSHTGRFLRDFLAKRRA